MQGEREVPVLVLGGLISALGAIRSLGRAGIRCHAVGDAAPYALRSRYHRPLPGVPGGAAEAAALPRLLEALPLPTAVLMPCADHWVRAVSALDAALLRRFPASLPSSDVVETFLDKGALLDALERFSVPAPATVRVLSETDLAELEGERGRTWFLKPLDSQRFKMRFGVKAFRVASREEAVSLWAEARAAGLGLLLQEYVPGDAGRHYFVDGFLDGRGVVRGLFARRRVRMHPPDFGDSSYMESIPEADVAPATDALLRLLRGVGYRGIFSAEFKRDPRDDSFRLIEVNARCWAYVEFATSCGVNTPLMAYRDALGLEVASATGYAVGRAECVMPQDALACFRLHREGRLRAGEAVRSWLAAQDSVFRWSDPLPAIARHIEAAARRWNRRRGVRTTAPSREG